MKGKQKIALCLAFLPLAIGLLAWWHWASQTVMRIKNYDTQHIYVEFPAKAGDRLFLVGFIHSNIFTGMSTSTSLRTIH